jgi:tRNA-Thr(GGU) m(6)t(6)A37 methyltransferase TsaA
MNTETTITYQPIGILHSEHKIKKQTPAQPVYAKNCEATLELKPELKDGLTDIEGFSHLIILYHFHEIEEPPSLLRKPILEPKEHGIFATRFYNRPNPIGLSIVKLIKVEENVLYLADVDILDNTPILDIKPYVKRFDHRDNMKDGWLEQIDENTAETRGKREYRQ